MNVVTHNLLSMNANRMLGTVTKRKANATEKLSSGYKINRAADDAAGLKISEKMRGQIRGLNRGSQNAQDGISLLQVADGALSEVNDMLHRITQLSVQAANDTNTTEDRRAIQEEINELIKEIDRIGKETEFNTMPVFDDITGNNPTPLPGRVNTNSTSHLEEAYRGSDGQYYPATILDFSYFNADNIDELVGKSFSFNCSQSCGEVFEFKFVDTGGNSATNLSGQVRHTYTIDVSGLTSGAEVVDAIMNYVSANTPNGYTTDGLGNPMVSHSNSLAKEGATSLVIYANWDRYPTADQAASQFPKPNATSGAVDIEQIKTGDVVVPPNELWIQSGANEMDGFLINIDRMNSMILGIDRLNVLSHKNASTSLTKAYAAGEYVTMIRGKLGAQQNRLEHSVANDDNTSENLQASESRLRDTDMATQTVELAKESILEQAGQAMLAQANQLTQGIINLISQ